MTASMPFNYWANNIFAGFRYLISSLHFMSHFIFTLFCHTPQLPPPYHPSPPQPTISTITATPLLKVFSDEAQRDKTTRKHSGDQRDYSDKRTTILEEEYVGESIYGEGVGISIMCDH
jgi:hypothetical protein